jgi:hypothetical protein
MLVYGDGERREATAEKMARLRAGLRTAGPEPRLKRHARLAGLLVEAGELAQGLLDEQLARLGEERWTPLSALSARLTRHCGEALRGSLRGEPLPGRGGALDALDRLAALDLPETIAVHLPEGYVHYGLYPETYLEAARALSEEPGPLQVIGIRSIGTGLAGAVAAAAGGDTSSRTEIVSVRPGGHPFCRRIDLGDDLGRRLLGPAGTRYAVVDEGPGLSGSSFGSVADWLEDRGVPAESIVFFPSHSGDLGPHASDRHRRRWARARRLTADFDRLFLAADAPLSLLRGVEELTGPAAGPLEDLRGGRWRQLLLGEEEARWPAVHFHQERRKLLLSAGSAGAAGGAGEAGDHRWLLKFAGLGRYGEEALSRAVALSQAGLSPPVAGLRHGFLVGPWLAGARPLPAVSPASGASGVDREALLDQVARHLLFLAERFPAPPGSGASPTRLLEMAAFNTGEALGADLAAELSRWRDRLPGLESRARTVATDNRMHAWEWLVLPDGRILKCDALDHHRGNDLVGAQDPAWDLAGAAVELALTGEERERLRERLERQGATRVPSRDLPFYEAAYLAFQLGHHTLAATALESVAPAEAVRHRGAAERYTARLRLLLNPPPNGRESAAPR